LMSIGPKRSIICYQRSIVFAYQRRVKFFQEEEE
jgi:hypothetical protein